MAADVSLLDSIADALPTGTVVRAYHISTPPTHCSPLFAAAPGSKEQATFCESHLIFIALPGSDGGPGSFVFALEIFVFTTETLTTIFVSKADSTGLLRPSELSHRNPSVIKIVSTAIIQTLVDARKGGPRIVLSLFARSQNQYLFPGSVEIPSKHVLSDRQLIKWWCLVLNPILLQDSSGSVNNSSDAAGYVLVPGSDKNETRAFFPPASRVNAPNCAQWKASYPVDLLVPQKQAPPRCLIPRFPDDPKARFLDDLDGEVIEATGKWKSVGSLEQFWEMMSYRQECSAGRLVGFVWVVLGNPKQEPMQQNSFGEAELARDVPRRPPTPKHSQGESSGNLKISRGISADFALGHEPESPPPSSPIQEAQRSELQPKLKANTEPPAGCFYDEAKTLSVRWPESTRGEHVMEADAYQLLMDHILKLDFSTPELAAQSTRDWVEKAAAVGGKSNWGRVVDGRNTAGKSISEPKAEPLPSTVNVLTAVRKKRKVVDIETTPNDKFYGDAEATVLSTNLIRKKPKA